MSQITRAAAARQPGGVPAPGRPVLATDRRQRKKQLTRDALIQAAMSLFEAKGYEQTAIHEITDVVDISERTFFRYFASKEDLVLSFVRDQMTAFAEALAARPPGEEPLTAACAAFHVSLRQPEARQPDAGGGQTPSYLSVIRLIESSPALLAAHLHYIHGRDDEIVRVLAQREGVDPAADRRPWLLAGMIGALLFLASRDCRAADHRDPEALTAAFDAYAGEIAAALGGHWAAAP